MSKHLFILYEHASGYSLFSVKEFDEISSLLPQVESSVSDVSKFQSVVKLAAFQAFKSGTNSLENINAIAAGEMHPDLLNFLEKELPKPKKKIHVLLGIGDSKIGASIAETFGVSCQHTGVIVELLRGIRSHFHVFVKALTERTAAKAQLGLGHSYSRDKVKFNVNRVDNMIIQSISLLDQLDKDINTFSMRIREWYSYHFPELVKIVPENHMFARTALLIGNRAKLQPDVEDQLEEIVMDSGRVKAIFEAAKSSMGFEIGPIDLINIQMFAKRVISLTEYRASLSKYLQDKMQHVAPNLAALIGEQVGARLISHAGSLTNLAKYPASTVQILGAEKALFRALKTRGNTPKYGLIFHSTFIGRAEAANKGRISRYLANKCSIASRVDTFSDFPTSVIGEYLKQQVEDRMTFYETGKNPAKNIDVMRQAVSEAAVAKEKVMAGIKKLEKKAKKRKMSAANGDLDSNIKTEAMDDIKKEKEMKSEDEDEEPPAKKKKKKKKSKENGDETLPTDFDTTQEMETPVKKKKKKKSKENVDDMDTTEEVQTSGKKEKKKKNLDVTLNTSQEEITKDDSVEKKKKKKKRKQEDLEESMNVSSMVDTSMDTSVVDSSKKKKKKKKSKTEEED